MKKLITTFGSLLFVLSVNSQIQPSVTRPAGMVFVPQGSFQMKISGQTETRLTHVTVGAFWMSNEITNAEFREFVDWAKKNPGEKLYQSRYSTVVFTDPEKGVTKDTVIAEIIPIEVSEFSSGMSDPWCLEKVENKYKNYSDEKKYNDYPVVGVSFKMAEYYCLWKTMMENNLMKENGLPGVHSYRIPLETEWEYAAQQPASKSGKSSLSPKIQKVNKGRSNEWGLFHLDNNVSEWVTPVRREKQGITRGGSWKTGNSISARMSVDPDFKDAYTGFRIVQSYVPEAK